MGQATEAAVRQKIVLDWQTGMSYAALARQYGMSYNTIRSVCRRYQNLGSSGLLPNYGRCGRKVEAQHDKVFRLIRLLKHLHPQWGVPYLVQRIEEKYPNLPLQSIRHYQRRLAIHGQHLPATILPKEPAVDRARQVHEVWEIDAKERIDLGEEHKACYLNITDEKSGAILRAQGFPPLADQSGPLEPDHLPIAGDI